MLFELSIIPLGEMHSSGSIAKALELVDSSGLPYRLTPTGTCIEGNWDQVMPLIQRCHEAVRGASAHVVTSIKIEDDENASDKMSQNIRSVEQKVGHRLKT